MCMYVCVCVCVHDEGVLAGVDAYQYVLLFLGFLFWGSVIGDRSTAGAHTFLRSLPTEGNFSWLFFGGGEGEGGFRGLEVLVGWIMKVWIY